MSQWPSEPRTHHSGADKTARAAAAFAQLVSIMRLLQLDGYFEGVETGTAATADSNAMNNTQGVLPRHEAVWGSFAGP
jgi:hypothetical protein